MWLGSDGCGCNDGQRKCNGVSEGAGATAGAMGGGGIWGQQPVNKVNQIGMNVNEGKVQFSQAS